MKRINFPYIALGFGLFLMLVAIKGGETGNDGGTIMPLLSLLVISEFAFFATAIGGYTGIKHMLSVGIKPLYAAVTVFCILLSIRFIWLGMGFWPL